MRNEDEFKIPRAIKTLSFKDENLVKNNSYARAESVTDVLLKNQSNPDKKELIENQILTQS